MFTVTIIYLLWGIIKFTTSYAPGCDPIFGGDVVYVQNGVCAGYSTGGRVWGLKMTWSGVCESPGDYTNPPNCKPLVSGLRDYAVSHAFMTLEESYHVCYVDGDEW